MTLAPLALVALVSASPLVRAVRVTTVDSRTAVRILTSDDVPSGAVAREGGEVVIRLPALGTDGLAAPGALAPLTAIRLEREGATTVIHLEVAPEVPYQVAHEPGMTTVVFGEQPAPELRGPVTSALYARLFPTGGTGTVEPQTPPRSEEGAGEFSFGRFALRPYLTASWVDADLQAFQAPQPVRARYLQLGPGVTLSVPFSSALLAAEYEPRLRFFSNLPHVDEPTHSAGARLELPLGSRTQLRLAHRYSRATLETTVVDPGREYFFDLSRYTFNNTTLAARVELGPRLFLEGEAGWRRARFDDPAAGFFGYDSRAARAGLGYDLRDDLRAVLSYSFESIPPSPGRTVVETSGQTITTSLSGSIGPLMTGALSAGLRSQTSPQAEGASRSYRGVTLSASLRRELGAASSLDLQLLRSTQISAFETNAYYVNNAATLLLTAPLPFQVSGSASLSFLRNDYPNLAAGLEIPRRDEILGWSVGLGRQLGWRAWIRADYRRERRDSNIPGFDVTTDGYVVQLGFGLPKASR